MAVSLASGASAKNTMVATGRRSTYVARPHNVRAAAIMSRWASELWAKNTGYNAVQSTVAAATVGLVRSRANRHKPANAKAATNSMAVRVTAGVKALNFHQKASHSITRGGCALESVV